MKAAPRPGRARSYQRAAASISAAASSPMRTGRVNPATGGGGRASRTSGQGAPGSSPERARASRCSISAAQAASASSSGSPSRLARSSAASSARSEIPSLSASSSSLLPAFVMPQSVLRGAQAQQDEMRRPASSAGDALLRRYRAPARRRPRRRTSLGRWRLLYPASVDSSSPGHSGVKATLALRCRACCGGSPSTHLQPTG